MLEVCHHILKTQATLMMSEVETTQQHVLQSWYFVRVLSTRAQIASTLDTLDLSEGHHHWHHQSEVIDCPSMASCLPAVSTELFCFFKLSCMKCVILIRNGFCNMKQLLLFQTVSTKASHLSTTKTHTHRLSDGNLAHPNNPGLSQCWS